MPNSKPPKDDPGDSVPIAVATETSGATGRTKRLGAVAANAVGEGMSVLGAGVEALGEGVTKLGGVTRKVPLVGQGVAAVGAGLTHVGESLTELPQMAKTRRGRLLVRSMLVGFVLVGAWIAAIVGLQLHGNDAPDLRPNAEAILVQVSHGGSALDEVWDRASPRFQEMVRKERFVDDMTDLSETVGKFREITAINDTLVTNSPTGTVARVSLSAAFDKAVCKGSVSLHWDQGRWKLLGINIELPPELKVTQAEREERVQACKDPMDIRKCDVHAAADAILKQLRDGHAAEVWDAANPVFQKQEDKTRFVQIQNEHVATLGNYRRLIAVTEAKVIGGTSATFDALAEFDKANGARTVFAFTRASKVDAWKLRSFKIVLPMPRAVDTGPTAPPPPVPTNVPVLPPRPR